MGLLRKAALIGAGYVGYKYLKEGARPDATLRDMSGKAQQLAAEGMAKLNEAAGKVTESR